MIDLSTIINPTSLSGGVCITVHIGQGTSVEAVAAIPDRALFLYIGQGASVEAVAAIPSSRVHLVYIGQGVAAKAVAAIPAPVHIGIDHSTSVEAVAAIPSHVNTVHISAGVSIEIIKKLPRSVKKVCFHTDRSVEALAYEALAANPPLVRYVYDKEQSNDIVAQLLSLETKPRAVRGTHFVHRTPDQYRALSESKQQRSHGKRKRADHSSQSFFTSSNVTNTKKSEQMELQFILSN